ncbi:MAG: hypothetical protein J6Z02_06860, partial [Lachnospiraceae bacterium]|nr:hypothetical protein [Lachnospiraceae bacterium]
MEKDQKKKQNRSLLINLIPGFLVLGVMIVMVFFKDQLFMKARYDLHTASGAAFAEDGKTVLIDESRSSIKILDKKMRLIKEYKGESENSFYYADWAVYKNGILYVADTKYDKNNKNIETKRLLTITDKKVNVYFEKKKDLTDIDSSNDILDIQVKNGNIYFLISVDYGLESYVIDKNVPWPKLLNRYYVGDKINDAGIDLDSGAVAIAVKRGYLRVYDPESGKWNNLEVYNDHIMPNRVAIKGEYLYFSDLYENKIYSMNLKNSYGVKTLVAAGDKPVFIETDETGKKLIAVCAGGFYVLEGVKESFVSSIRYSGFYKTLLLWAVA